MRLTLISFLLVTISPTLAQKAIQFGLKTGANLSMFSASINSSPSVKPGFHIGGYLRTDISEKFHFRPELYFSSQGQKDNYETAGGQSVGSTTTTISAINLPLLFEAGRKVTFQFGAQVGFLLGGNEKGSINNQKVDEDLKDVMKPVDLALVVGLGFYPAEHFNFGVRSNFGVTTIFDPPSNAPPDFPTVANRVFHFYLAYSF
ncbi:MAG TPA: porin family protein [Cyclobacteriaceae bacterium]|nr:porin family protein [Cyclobacteriaceae bacterium]